LVIDLDPQGNASTALGIDHFTGTPSVYEVIIEGHPLAEVIQQCEAIPSLLCAPATIDLAGAEVELVSLVAREGRLRKAVEDYSNDVDYIHRLSAVARAPDHQCWRRRGLLIPINANTTQWRAWVSCEERRLVKAHLNPRLAISTILLTMYDARTTRFSGCQ
jgi:chromosome partitioning protein